MINLIPDDARNQLRTAQVWHIFSTFGFFVAAIIVIGFAALLPSLIRLRFMIADFTYAREVEERSPIKRALEEQTRALTDLESRARDVLAHARTTPSFEDILQEVARIAPAGIDFLTTRFEEESFIIEGHYEHRSSFLAFLEALKTNALVKSISSPLSNLLKESDALFSITLTL